MPIALSRRRVPERMDDPALDPGQHAVALAGLSRINRWTGAVVPFAAEMIRLARRTTARPLRVLDVATGFGDLPIALDRLARRQGVEVEVSGCDLSPTAVELARSRVSPAHFFRHDAVRDPLPTGYHMITNSLFLHHLDEPDVVRVLAAMKAAAGDLVVVGDLVRSRLNLGLVSAACRLLSRSPVVHYDGPASVRAAYTPDELRTLAAHAGLDGAVVRRAGPCRMTLTWSRS
jgi:2-polyprenyl-3-methyl-5-hydroxy-6-metoxy-1,4-benzoquinol methylase